MTADDLADTEVLASGMDWHSNGEVVAYLTRRECKVFVVADPLTELRRRGVVEVTILEGVAGLPPDGSS